MAPAGKKGGHLKKEDEMTDEARQKAQVLVDRLHDVQEAMFAMKYDPKTEWDEDRIQELREQRQTLREEIFKLTGSRTPW